MKQQTPMKSIRSKCLDCSGGQPKEVRSCPHEDCSLYPYRFGKNPNRTGKGGFSRKLTTQLEVTNV